MCPLPLDPKIYRPRGGDEDRQLIPREEGEIIIGYVGRIVEPKGLRTLAAALPKLRDLRWKLVVIGKGDFEETFRQLLQEGGVIDRVTFLGFVPHVETPRYLSAFDILVVPSETQPNWKEQFGRVITEAMASGTPVVGSSSGEIPNLIQKADGGLIFPEKNAEEFAACLRALMTQNELRERYADNGRKWVEREVSLAAVARKMAHTLESVAGRAPQQRLNSGDLRVGVPPKLRIWLGIAEIRQARPSWAGTTVSTLVFVLSGYFLGGKLLEKFSAGDSRWTIFVELARFLRT